MMLERNRLDRELEKAKKAHREQITSLESRLEESEKLSSLSAGLSITHHTQAPQLPSPEPQLPSPASTFNAPAEDHAKLLEHNRSLEDDKQVLTDRLTESDEQVFKLTAELQLMKSHNTREVQDLKMALQKAIATEAHDKLQSKLEQQTKRCRELEEALNVHSSQSGKLLIGE